MEDPKPNKNQLKKIYKAGLRAPDHGGLNPWKFIEVSGKDRLLFKDKLIDYCENKKTKHIARKAYLTDFLQHLINNGFKIKEIPINGNWIEIDSHDDANAAKKSGRLSNIEKDINRIMNKN